MPKTHSTCHLRATLGSLLAAVSLSACYVVPATAPDGTVRYDYYPLPPPGTAIAPPPHAGTAANLTVTLYPANEQAASTGIVRGSVTNLMTGKGRFVVNYQGDVLSGEATRVSNEEKRGIASAFGTGGMYMSCEYQMNTPYQGAGTCSFANGAKYQMHIGN